MVSRSKYLLLSIATLCGLLCIVSGERKSLSGSMVDMPERVQSMNMIQVTEESCSGCTTMEKFLRDNDWALVLFYRLPTRGANRYIWAMKDNVSTPVRLSMGLCTRGQAEQACAKLALGRLACGRVDVYIDRKYPMQFNIDPKTVPAIVILHRGVPKDVSRKQLDALMIEKTVDSVIRYIRQQMSPSRPELVSRVVSLKSFRREIAKNDLVVAAFTNSTTEAENFRRAAQTLLLKGRVPRTFINPGRGMRDEEIRLLQVSQESLTRQLGHAMDTLRVWIAGSDDVKEWSCAPHTVNDIRTALPSAHAWEEALKVLVESALHDFRVLRPLERSDGSPTAGSRREKASISVEL
ncbi:hypothetical protein FOZ62_002328 [Perkinsus olseni]|uniref:Uncharacterized protein n=1 Tax=Perkinsus olseni TaxID=32597 RepID=A0A7J6QRM2_PEROL|nr:hypothetical protein FOZ62_002328 [Perkinsus olseni]